MWKCVRDLWTDQRGFIVSIEMILIVTVGVLALIVGLNCVANAVVAEYQDIGWAMRSLNQSFWFGGFRGCKSFVPGSAFTNRGFAFGGPFFTEGVADIGLNPGPWGYGVAPGYAAPGYVAPSTASVQPCPTCVPDGSVTPSTTLDIPCPTGDCATDKVVPGATIQADPNSPPVTVPRETESRPTIQPPIDSQPVPEADPQPVPRKRSN